MFLLVSFNSNDDNEKQINQILNEIVEQDSTILDMDYQMVDGFNSANQVFASDYVKKYYFKKLEPYFSSEDIEFYKEQIKLNKKCKLRKQGVFKSLRFISKDTVTEFIAKSEYYGLKEIEYDFYANFEKKLGKIQEFGLPFFSKDGRYVAIRFYCKSAVAPKKSRGFNRIYEKQNKKWIIVKTIDDWQDNDEN
jgi:hypothetical protein